MKKDNLIDIPIVPEEYGTDCFHGIDIIKDDPKMVLSEMFDVERKFINGLIRYYEPENVLEVGVSGGGGSAVLLDAISGIENSSLTSIDIAKLWYRDENRKAGFVVKEVFPDLPHTQWDLILGDDPSKILPVLNKRFDFAIIDTAHVHPVEPLNFLAVLPFLNDGAIVVLHDISLSAIYGSSRSLAPRLLWSSVAANKLVPRLDYQPVKYNKELVTTVCNIGAFQVSKDTRKYIRNVFESLMVPWELFPDTVDTVGAFLESYYNTDLLEIFKKSAWLNKVWFDSKFTTNSSSKHVGFSWLSDPYEKWFGKPVIFYGAGQNMQYLLRQIELCDMSFDFPIWDINAESIIEVRGHKVVKPDFESVVSYGHVAVITIQNKSIASIVREQLEKVGFIVMSLDGFLGLS